jgi:hypothetical protein
LKTQVKIEDVKKYLELAEKKSYEKLQEESKKSKKEKNSIGVRYWYGRWQSYKKLLREIFAKDGERYSSRLLKIEDFLKLLETIIKSLHGVKDVNERERQLKPYLDITYMILGKDDDRENLRLDKEANLRKL